MNVQILSTKLITPSSPTPHHLQNFKVSWIDQFYPPRQYVPLIFYYPSNGDENNVERSKQLQKSLSETLTIFYPLAGRCTEDSLVIDCDDKGVEYVEARVSGCLSQLLKRGELETELRNRLVANTVQPDNRPLMLIQFNMFESGGVAIGLCVSHRAADGYTMFTFVNAWATACKLGIDKVLYTPSFQLSSFFPSRDTISSTNPIIGDNQKIIIMKRFVFTGAALSKLKAVASASVNGSRQPTRVEVVAAVIWKTLTMVAQAKHGRLRPSILSLPINMRGKIAMPIPDNSCGNFASVALSYFSADDESKVQLHDFVDRVHNGIKKMVADCAKVSSDDELFVLAMKIRRETMEAFFKDQVDFYICKSMCRMPIYEADFGWGKPGWFSGCTPRVELVYLTDTKDGDGIEAWVSLEENSMKLFQENPDIKAFTGRGL